MSLGLVISLAVILASLYFLGLVGYRLFLSIQAFRKLQAVLSEMVSLLQKPIESEFLAAEPSSSHPIAQVLAKREQFKREQVKHAQARRLRLVKHLETLDLDKR